MLVYEPPWAFLAGTASVLHAAHMIVLQALAAGLHPFRLVLPAMLVPTDQKVMWTMRGHRRHDKRLILQRSRYLTQNTGAG